MDDLIQKDAERDIQMIPRLAISVACELSRLGWVSEGTAKIQLILLILNQWYFWTYWSSYGCGRIFCCARFSLNVMQINVYWFTRVRGFRDKLTAVYREQKKSNMADQLQRANLTISAFTLQIVTVSLREWKVAISSGNDWRNGGYWTQNRPVSSAGDTDARETSL